jgi:hypothetical protein
MALAMCLSAPVFSQMRMNGWGRVVWVPYFIDQQEDPRSTLQAPWGDRPDLEFMFAASSTNIGVDLGVMVAPNEFYQIGNAKVWWRPNQYFKLHLGSGRVPTLRGKVPSSTGGYAYARGRLTGLSNPTGKDDPVIMIDDGDGIFSRFNLTDQGAILELTPIEGLYIGAAVAPQWIKDGGNLAETVYKGIHAVIGYEIKDIGHLRLGFIGGNEEDGETANASKNWDFSYDRRIEAAFALTAVQNLLVDTGFKYSLHEHPGILAQPGFSLENPLYIALGVVYSGIENLSLGFAIDGHFAGTAKMEDGDAVTSAPQIAFNIYPTYSLSICDIGADFTYGMQFGDEEGLNDRKLLGFGVHAQKSYGHGNFRIGIYVNAPMNEDQKLGMSIPTWITYSF